MSEDEFHGYGNEQDREFAERRVRELARWRRFQQAAIVLIPDLFGDFAGHRVAEPPVAPPKEDYY